MIQELRVDQIEPNDYNPNVLKGEKYEALKEDVAAGDYDPILVSPKTIFYADISFSKDTRYVIIDGEWRWRAAKQLGLTTIKADVKEIARFKAKTITFRKNRERGNLDPFKEAKLFDDEMKAGLTEEKVAKRFGVSRSYVAGRRMLLKLSSTVIDLHRKPGETLKQITRESLEESVKADEDYVQQPAEVVKAQIEEEASNVVPRGTLTSGHLKAIAVLPEDDQVELATSVLLQDSSVRATEQASRNMLERIRLRKEFEKALEKARQKTCPYCGGQPKGFRFSGEDRFQCSQCYNSWDFMVTKEELKEQQAERETSVSTDRKEQIKKRIKNPRYIRRKETVEELMKKIRVWVLRKVEELVEIQNVDIVGTRKDGQQVNISFPGSWGKGLAFGVGTKEEGAYYWNWKKRLAFRMEAKSYKTVDAKTKIDLSVAASPEHRVELHRFLDEIVNTDQDPFLPEKDIEELLKKYGETKETA